MSFDNFQDSFRNRKLRVSSFNSDIEYRPKTLYNHHYYVNDMEDYYHIEAREIAQKEEPLKLIRRIKDRFMRK